MLALVDFDEIYKAEIAPSSIDKCEYLNITQTSETSCVLNNSTILFRGVRSSQPLKSTVYPYMWFGTFGTAVSYTDSSSKNNDPSHILIAVKVRDITEKLMYLIATPNKRYSYIEPILTYDQDFDEDDQPPVKYVVVTTNEFKETITSIANNDKHVYRTSYYHRDQYALERILDATDYKGWYQEPVVKNGQVVPGNIMKLTLSCDHRVVDGATGAAFLQTLKQLLEEPVRMLV